MGLRAKAYDCRVATFFAKSYDLPVMRAPRPDAGLSLCLEAGALASRVPRL
jgi:hypothetical protein